VKLYNCQDMDDYQTTYKISILVENAEADFKHFIKKEKELVNALGQETEFGTITFSNPQDSQRYADEMEKLRNTDSERVLSAEKIYIRRPSDLRLSPRDIKPLKLFIEFVEEDSKDAE